MRPPPPPAAPPHTAHLSPPIPSTETRPCDPRIHNCRWWPYSNSNEFAANATMILIILFCALISALALNAAIRCFLRGSLHRRGRLPRTQQQHQERKSALQATAAPSVVAHTLVFSAGMKLDGAGAECAICLSEFVDGDGIQVLGRCKHGFHVQCIQQWLSSHSSCPTCRSNCLASSPSSAESINCCSENGLDNHTSAAVLDRSAAAQSSPEYASR